MARGACLCGAVRYEIEGPLRTMLSCHCSICRKHHGALFVTFVSARHDALRWIAGEERIARYRSSAAFDRPFCERCGAPVATPAPRIGLAFAPAGALEDDPGLRPQGHIFAASMAPWHEITDALPRHAEYPDTFRKVRAVPGPAPAPAPREGGAVRGRCLCGDVCFELVGAPGRMTHCHCSRCRRSRGAAHATNVFVPADGLRWLDGEDRIRRYEAPEAESFAACFCPRCGGKLPTIHPRMDSAVVPAGALDDDPGVRAAAHVFVGSKAPWFEITDDIPRFAGYPRGR